MIGKQKFRVWFGLIPLMVTALGSGRSGGLGSLRLEEGVCAGPVEVVLMAFIVAWVNV